MENIRENIIKIASFMEVLTVDMNGNIKEDLESLKYHKDWNLLMPVVEKINQVDDGQFDVSIFVDSCIIDRWIDSFNIVTCEVGASLIENVFLACAGFIEWYKNQNK